MKRSTYTKPPNGRGTMRPYEYAHKNNQTDCVHYLLDNNCPLPEGWSYENGELYVRIRIRIRIIAQVLKLPATLCNKERKERDTNQTL